MQVVIDRVCRERVGDVVGLLGERNGTLPEYTLWKYGHDDDVFRGVVARLDGEPVGFFGVHPRELELADGSRTTCGWCADWYVSPRADAAGTAVRATLAMRLLRAVKDVYPLAVAQPAPENARALCVANGFRPVGFQSRRRWVLRRLSYERVRTSYLAKAVYRTLWNGLASGPDPGQTDAPGEPLPTDAPRAKFSDPEAHGRWVLRQPVRPGVRREGGAWQQDGIRVAYIDDLYPNGESRRRVLHSEGEGQSSPRAWADFVRAGRREKVTYIEVFTTDRALDQAFALAGARPYPDSPALIAGRPDLRDGLVLHGWDRESWTFLADNS